MHRITDVWSGLGRREQVLVAIGVGTVLLLLIWLVAFRGGDQVAPIDASTTAVDSTAGPIEPTPGMIVANEVPPEAAPEPAPAPTGVAPIAASGSGGDAAPAPSEDVVGRRMEEAANAAIPSDVTPGERYVPPKVSAAVKAAGRSLEAVARNYVACMQRLAGQDTRPCMNTLVDGVSTFSNVHDDGRGITLTKMSSDGHRLDYTVIKGQVCRTLDDGDSCDGWTAN